ncbi:caveolin-3-like [Ruditapes philippinarum]|uniref:caveolin-3-like n=1 Tax=Ruditapes philippinarum TaxID=129788 RepID=UPI00295B5BAD|nr:caveolin-3-like [Ruditapes philippinarum]
MASDSNGGEIKLTVGEDKVTTADVTKGEEIDLKNRDPENLHDHIKIQFHDVFGEPDETVFSFDFVWRFAFKLFTNVKLWCYRIVSLICGLPLAIFWGIYFAMLSFCAIWCCEPYMKAYAIELGCIRRLFNTMLNAFVRPCFEVMGYCFYNIRVQKG